LLFSQYLIRYGACEREVLFETGSGQGELGAPNSEEPVLSLFRLEARIDFDLGAEDIGDRVTILRLGNSANSHLHLRGLAGRRLRTLYARRGGDGERSHKGATHQQACLPISKQFGSPSKSWAFGAFAHQQLSDGNVIKVHFRLLIRASAGSAGKCQLREFMSKEQIRATDRN
jgi:hypothetical protein